jgi:predicted ArsR family transcriptional regulator
MQHRMRITYSSVDKFHAIAHAIGQWHDVGVDAVPTAWLAKFMGVSKPTAIKHLNSMVEIGYLDVKVSQWRKNAVQYQWYQTENARMKYHKGVFKNYFSFVKGLILQTAKMPGRGKLTI